MRHDVLESCTGVISSDVPVLGQSIWDCPWATVKGALRFPENRALLSRPALYSGRAHKA